MFALVLGAYAQLDIPMVTVEYDVTRYLSEINDDSDVDSYPWISEDGLRLYYTTNVAELNHVVYTYRESINEEFRPPVKLPLNDSVPGKIFNCWLSADELTIFFSNVTPNGDQETSLFKANREDINDNFANIQVINLLGGITGLLMAPSLTQDFEQLYLFHNHLPSIVVFEKVNDTNYQLIDTLDTPPGLKPSPGALSKDGLKYYLGFTETEDTDQYFIFYCERENTTTPFQDYYYLNNPEVNDSTVAFGNLIPNIGQDQGIMVMVKNNPGTWQGNELFIAQNETLVSNKDKISSNTSSSHLFPNPGHDVVYHLLPKNYQSTVVYNSKGQETTIKPTQQGNLIALDINELPYGLYHYHIVTSNKVLKGQFIVGN